MEFFDVMKNYVTGWRYEGNTLFPFQNVIDWVTYCYSDAIDIEMIYGLYTMTFGRLDSLDH